MRCVVRDEGRTIVVLACDGAGSASHGSQGAAIASRFLSQAIGNHLVAGADFPTDEMVDDWIDELRDRLATVASNRGLEPRDFATTVVATIATATAAFCLHIGDGVAVGRKREGSDWIALSWPEQGEYASTTYFLTDASAPRYRISRIDTALDRLAVMSDGIERIALDFARLVPHGPFFEGVSRPVAASEVTGHDLALSRQLSVYLDSVAVNARTDDDKTLILAAWR